MIFNKKQSHRRGIEESINEDKTGHNCASQCDFERNHSADCKREQNQFSPKAQGWGTKIWRSTKMIDRRNTSKLTRVFVRGKFNFIKGLELTVGKLYKM